MKLSLITGFCVALLTGAALADEVVLKNGNRLVGTVLKEDEDTLVLRIGYESSITLRKRDIESVTAGGWSEPLSIPAVSKKPAAACRPAPRRPVQQSSSSARNGSQRNYGFRAAVPNTPIAKQRAKNAIEKKHTQPIRSANANGRGPSRRPSANRVYQKAPKRPSRGSNGSAVQR